MENEKIKPLYGELQGYLSQVPVPKEPGEIAIDASVWNQYNHSVDLLNEISEEDFSRFKIQPSKGVYGEYIPILWFRLKLAGLILHLHRKYFSDEQAPFSGMPTTVITQSQQENQSVQILLEVQSKIDEKINQFKEGSNEKTFLQKLKGTLASTSNISQLLNTIFTLANQNGISLETLSSIFT